MQYKKEEDGTLIELPKKNVDFGGGLERMAAAVNGNPDVFKIDIFSSNYSINFYSNHFFVFSNSILHSSFSF
jgi:alanyl-tRNA synthetase